MQPSILEQITSRTRLKVDQRKALADMSQLTRRAQEHAPRGFAARLRETAALGPAVIAELKKASPSKGLLREDYRPAEIAPTYEKGGAAAISVLTDEEFFQGSLADLAAVSQAVTIPVLRKDFVVDTFQILEARAAGADAILLIVASHSDDSLLELAAYARELQLDVLCEVHDHAELERALALGFDVIGVNCRNLKTMQVDTAGHEELVRHMPSSVLRVAESGLRTPDDIQRLRAAGYDAFLIGETLMKHPDPAAQLALLLASENVPAS